MENTEKIPTAPMNAETNEDSAAAPNRKRQALQISPWTSRTIAAFIDYLVILALGLTFSSFVEPQYQFVLTFIAGLIYYGVGNSVVTQGQTLGKKAFNLQTLDVRQSTGRAPFLPIRQSMARYFFSFGALIIAAELPHMYYRAAGLIAAPAIQEINMLFVCIYGMTTIAYVFLSVTRRGIHDLLVHSIVVRNETPSETAPFSEFVQSLASAVKNNKQLIRDYRAVSFIGVTLGFLIWSPILLQHPESRVIHGHRFQIEKKFPIILTSVQYYGNGYVELSGLIRDTQEITSHQNLAENITDYLRQAQLLQESVVDIGFRLYPPERTTEIDAQTSPNTTTAGGNEKISPSGKKLLYNNRAEIVIPLREEKYSDEM